MKLLLKPVLVVALAIIATLPGAAAQDNDAYQQGQAALRARDFGRAVEAFDQAQRTDQRNDAAAYWYAYALRQAGRERQALQAAGSMLRRFPASGWADDARALQAELGAEVAPDAAEELRLYALYHLMDANPERGMALLRDMLKETDSADTRRHLLFLLAGQDDVRISREIMELARNDSDPELQVQAIHVIAASGHSDGLALLADIYSDSADPRVRSAIIEAHIVADSPQALAAIVRQEQNPELIRQGVMALGAMDASAELRGLYPTLRDNGLRQTLLEAFAISGDSAELAAIIKSETDPQIRALAIRSLGMSGDDAAHSLLLRMAGSTTAAAEQHAILEALTMLDAGADIAVVIARSTRHLQVQQQALRTLAMLDATDELMAVYGEMDQGEPALQRALLEALMMTGEGVEIALQIARQSADPGVVGMALETLSMLDAGDELVGLYHGLADPVMRQRVIGHIAVTDSQALLSIVETESDPALRAQAIAALPDSSDAATPRLVALYPAAGVVEKRAVIDALVVLDAGAALAGLLDAERDVALQRRLLEALLATGSDEAEEYLFQWLQKNR